MITQETVPIAEIPTAIADAAGANYPRLSAVEAVAVLLARKRLTGLLTLLIVALPSIIILRMPGTYKAEATIMPPQQQQSSLSLLAIGAVSGGMASQFGLKSPADLYIGILKCRTIADDLVARFRLTDVYRKSRVSDARKSLNGKTTFVSGKDTLITIVVQDRDAKRAAAIANAYVDELYKQNSRLALTDASQRRLFYEQQLSEQRELLSRAEVDLKQFQESTGLLLPSGQGELFVHANAQVRAEIASREVDLQALRAYATEENPKLQVLEREIAALKAQLSELDKSDSYGSKVEIPGNKLPETSLQYVRKLREVKYHEALYELLSKQYEAARIDEAKQAPVIQIIDRAVVPDKLNTPPRLVLIVGAAVLGLLLSAGSVLTIEWARKLLGWWTIQQQAPSLFRGEPIA